MGFYAFFRTVKMDSNQWKSNSSRFITLSDKFVHFMNVRSKRNINESYMIWENMFYEIVS